MSLNAIVARSTRIASDPALPADSELALLRLARGVTTAATSEMAELCGTLGKGILASERPPKLKGDALEEYNSLLEEQVFPFEEQAIKAHELNAARAKDGVYDEWVRKSFQALAQLKPARYGKTELTQDVVTSLE